MLGNIGFRVQGLRIEVLCPVIDSAGDFVQGVDQADRGSDRTSEIKFAAVKDYTHCGRFVAIHLMDQSCKSWEHGELNGSRSRAKGFHIGRTSRSFMSDSRLAPLASFATICNFCIYWWCVSHLTSQSPMLNCHFFGNLAEKNSSEVFKIYLERSGRKEGRMRGYQFEDVERGEFGMLALRCVLYVNLMWSHNIPISCCARETSLGDCPWHLLAVCSVRFYAL